MLTAALATVAGAVVAHGTFAPNSPVFGPVIGRGPREPAVYLTFDDGPNPHWTEPIARLLEQEGVPATFFMVGRHVHDFPDVARAVAACGHTLGNHTYTHSKLALQGWTRILDEFARTHAAIEETTGVRPVAFRAPHGYRNPFVAGAAQRFGYPVVGWTFGVWDTDRPGADVIRTRMRVRLCPGAILLLHDGDGYDPEGDRRQTLEALPGILDDIRGKGWHFRPLPALFGT
jgi:peptidoglycan-N-acetylglucosamine deacetylase